VFDLLLARARDSMAVGRGEQRIAAALRSATVVRRINERTDRFARDRRVEQEDGGNGFQRRGRGGRHYFCGARIVADTGVDCPRILSWRSCSRTFRIKKIGMKRLIRALASSPDSSLT